MANEHVPPVIGAIAFDCDDPPALVRFYVALFGADQTFIGDDFATVNVDGTWISAHRVPGYRPPTWPADDTPKQVHLDIAVADVEAAVARVLELGGVVAESQPRPDRWRVMLDPAGHPFCLSPRAAFPNLRGTDSN